MDSCIGSQLHNPPEFVTVKYYFNGTNNTDPQIWFWRTVASHFFTFTVMHFASTQISHCTERDIKFCIVLQHNVYNNDNVAEILR